MLMTEAPDDRIRSFWLHLQITYELTRRSAKLVRRSNSTFREILVLNREEMPPCSESKLSVMRR
jgi:hypothetical protein